MAGAKIFNSRIEPVEDWKHDVLLPLCVVYTDHDKDHWVHALTNFGDRTLAVTFELLIAQISPVSSDPQAGFVLDQPNTDSELETSLDIFELQISNALRADNAAANCWRHLVYSYASVISRRGATAEAGAKLAARQITVEGLTPKGPTNGTIPPAIVAFLDELERHEDYADRVPGVRELYQAPGSLTAAEQLIRTMGWADEALTALGYRRQEVFRKEPIVWLDAIGRPLGA